jgi:hypothetical protein
MSDAAVTNEDSAVSPSRRLELKTSFRAVKGSEKPWRRSLARGVVEKAGTGVGVGTRGRSQIPAARVNVVI